MSFSHVLNNSYIQEFITLEQLLVSRKNRFCHDNQQRSTVSKIIICVCVYVCVCVCVHDHMFMLVTYLSQANVISTYHKLERITQKRYSAANYGMPHTVRGEQIVCVYVYVYVCALHVCCMLVCMGVCGKAAEVVTVLLPSS